MKKVCMYMLAALFTVALMPNTATAQSSRTSVESLLKEVFSRRQQEGNVGVSRKKTETRRAPQQEGAGTDTRQGRAPSRKRGGYESPPQRREGGRYEERPGRNRQGGYEGQGQERQERDGHRTGRKNGSCKKGQGNAANNKGKSSKSKCNIHHCSHPGKHKGLHKNR